LGKRPSDRDFRQVTQLGERIADGGYSEIAGIESEEILMPYKNEEEPSASSNGRG
jgi:hypothetical protein